MYRILMMMLSMTFAFPNVSYAKEIQKINVYVQDKNVQFEIPPIKKNDVTYVEMRSMCKAVSGTMQTTNKVSSCYKGKDLVEGKNGFLKNNRLMIPIKNFAGKFGYTLVPLEVSGDIQLMSRNNNNAPTTKLIEQYLKRLNQLGRFNGSNLVAVEDQIITRKGYGYANEKIKLPNTPSTKFAIASITKSFTGLAIMQLVEKNKIKVTDSVNKYLPHLPYAKNITVHQLLTHTAGLPWNIENGKFENVKLIYKPGTSQRYSNIGYMLLGKIIEKVTGESYQSYIRKNVINPIGLKNTGYDLNKSDSLTQGYEKTSAGQYKAISMDFSSRGASGGLYSTVDDLYLWDRALYQTQLVNEKSKNDMFSSKYNSWGYGWINFNADMGKISQLSGSTKGFRTHIKRNTTKNYVIILLSNHMDEKLDIVAKDIEKLMLIR